MNGLIKNAKIKYSFLGVDESGALVAYLGFEYKENNEWQTIKTNEIVLLDPSFIKDVLNVLEVRSWEELPRKFARIRIDGFKVGAIGNLIEEKWMEVK